MTTSTLHVILDFGSKQVLFNIGEESDNDITDDTEDTMNNQDDKPLYVHKGQVITRLRARMSDGSILTELNIKNSDSGYVVNLRGGEHTNDELWDIYIDGLQIKVEEGFTLNALTTD